MSALQAYRDDGPLLELAARAVRARPSALPWTVGALLPLSALFLVPAERAPLALAAGTALAVLLAAPAYASPHRGRLDWLVPPLLRAAEYGALLRLAVLQDDDTVPACYLLLAALAYHHYDLVYRLRDRGELPSPALRRAGLGWEGRLLVAAALAALDVLGPALLVLGAVLLVVYVAAGALAWRRGERPA